MTIATDFSVAANGDIRYTGSGDNHTVIAFHRWLQDLADDASSSGDDLIDITAATPSDRSTDNIITMFAPYNIDDVVAQHLYDGSIIQAGGDEIYDGITNFGVQGIHIELLQNGSLITPNFWTTGINADVNAGISHRFMVKVRSGGVDIDGRRLVGLAREFGSTYSEFVINGTARGNNVLALTQSADLNNQTAEGTVSGWTDIVNNNEGFSSLDVTGDGTDEHYYSEWTKGGRTINQLYERLKWLARRGSAETLYGLSADIFRGITHQVAISSPSGTFVEPEALSWGSGETAGTGQLLAIDSPTAGTMLYMQLLTGVVPNGNTITGAGGATATAGTVTARPVSTPFVGASTGSAIIGSYGLGITPGDLSASDKLFDLDNAQQTPPNNVQFSVLGLVSSEDRVLVAPESGGTIQIDQLSISGSHSAGAATITVQEAIPTDTPATGTVRVWDGDSYSRVTYTGWSGSQFTGCSGCPACSDGDNIFVSYIDVVAAASTESFTSVYSSDRSLFIRVRDGGATPIKTFETTAILGSSGGSATAIRTSDA